MHVGELVTLPRDRQCLHVLHIGTHDEYGSRRPAPVYGVDDDERIDMQHQLLHEVDAADTGLDYPDVVGNALLDQPLHHCGAEAIVTTQDVSHTCDQYCHIGGGYGALMDVQNAVDEVGQRLARYPADRYPVQHATAQFHLGVLLTDANRLEEAAQALDVATALLPPDGLAAEHAKATNARGVVFRLAGQFDEAVDAFERAAARFATVELPRDRGAALFNLGLVQRDRGDTAAAADCFGQARDHFDADSAPGEAGAAARELGATLLVTGELDAATQTLESAVSLADRAADTPGLGASANLLGLVHLGAGRPEDAVAAFRDALGAHPRTVRPGEHAMAKANLALAYEGTGATDHAYLAAVQALGITGAAEPVREQAAGCVERLGRRDSAVLPVLDQEPQDRWPVLVREELARWADAELSQRRAECAGWLDGQLARRAAAADLTEAWLGGLLETPPDAMMSLIRAMLEVLAERDDDDIERFRSTVSRTVVRFPMPQWMRLADSFNAVATELGQEASWG